MQEKVVYRRPKVIGPFPGPCASGSYVHRAAFFLSHYIAFLCLQNSTLSLEEVTNVVNNQSIYLTLTLFLKQSALLCEMLIVDKRTLSFNIIFSSFSGLV
jgi:hypothetical protein